MTSESVQPGWTTAQKRARVHALRDPLGAAGFRSTRARRKREEHARLAILTGALLSFVAIFTGIALSGEPSGATGQATGASSGVTSGSNVIGEYVIPAGDGQTRPTLVRIVAPTPHVTTRSS